VTDSPSGRFPAKKRREKFQNRGLACGELGLEAHHVGGDRISILDDAHDTPRTQDMRGHCTTLYSPPHDLLRVTFHDARLTTAGKLVWQSVRLTEQVLTLRNERLSLCACKGLAVKLGAIE
jgi:hypothetical protein